MHLQFEEWTEIIIRNEFRYSFNYLASASFGTIDKFITASISRLLLFHIDAPN